MAGRGEDALGGAFLDDAAQVHDGDAGGEVAHHAEVVGDEQIGEVLIRLQVGEQVEDLGLDRNVERGGGLVADEQARLHGQRAGDADALALPAGELVRVAPHGLGVEAHLAHQLGDARGALLVAGADAEGVHTLGDGVAHGGARVEGGARVLHDDLQAPPVGMEVSRRQRREIDAVEADAAAGRLDQPQDAATHGGLAAAQLAHQRQGLAAPDGEVDPIDGSYVAGDALQDAGADRKPGLEAAQLQQRTAVRGGHGRASCSTRWHQADCVGDTPERAGASLRQRSNACGQRGWKRQAAGHCPGRGTAPLISSSRWPRASGLGMERKSPCV